VGLGDEVVFCVWVGELGAEDGFAKAGEGDGVGGEIAEGGEWVDADSGYAGAGGENVSSKMEGASAGKDGIIIQRMMLAHTLVPKPPPVEVDQDGVLRVGGTRVTLDTVIKQYLIGNSPEQIVEAYDTLRLADVHAVISYYLSNRSEVDSYLDEQDKLAVEMQREIERRSGTWSELRAKLLQRKGQMGK
jgi:uncharacterized protein (DUF433 family)